MNKWTARLIAGLSCLLLLIAVAAAGLLVHWAWYAGQSREGSAGMKDVRDVMRDINAKQAEMEAEDRKFNESLEADRRTPGTTRSVDDERDRVQRQIEALQRRRDELDGMRKQKVGR